MQNLTPSPEYIALRGKAISDLSKSTTYLLAEDETRERMIDGWISGYYFGSIQGHTRGMESAINIINGKP